MPPSLSRADQVRALLRHIDSQDGPLTVTVRGAAGVFRLEVPAAPPSASGALPPATGCGADTWRILTEARSRLTLGEVMAEMAEHSLEWDERTVRRHLKRLMELGLVDHDDRARPPGYQARTTEE